MKTTANQPMDAQRLGRATTPAGAMLCRVLVSILVLLAPLGTWAQEPAKNTLESISYSSLPGERLQFSLKFAGPAPEPMSFTIDNPARIALDFPNTKNGLTERSKRIGLGVTRNVTAVEAKGRTRVVLDLAKMVSYQTQVSGNEVILTLAGGAGVPGAAAAPPAVMGAAPTATGEVVGKSVSNIDFRRGPEGEARILVTLSSPNIPVDLKDQRGKVILDIFQAQLPSELERRLDVGDFATPVQTIDTFRSNGNVRIAIAATGEYEQLAYQSDNIFTVEIKPFVAEAAEVKDEFAYAGEKLSLNFQDIEVRSVLQLIADFTGLNVVVSDSVSGNLTLRLKNVPWDQALDIILKTKGLDMRQAGNVLLIAPAAEIAAREKQELEARESLAKLAPLRTELVQINYAKATDIAALLIETRAAQAVGEGEAGGGSVLSPRGSVTVDARTNTLLVRDTDDSLVAVRRLIKDLDIPVRQVLIESRIVIANDDFSKELGVRWGASYADFTAGPDNDPRGEFTSGSLESTTDAINGDPLDLNERLNVNLPVTDPTGSLALALTKIAPDLLIELELSAAQAESRAEVVSAPRVITSNQTQARIEQGVEIPYQESTSSGATSVTFKEAVLSLDVTPSITPDDRVNMDLAVNKDSVGQLVDLGIGGNVPSIDTNKVQTSILVDNGQTVVLGGIYEQTTIESTDRVPFFGELPLVGRLFRTDLTQDNKAELLIFVTPKIIAETASLAP